MNETAKAMRRRYVEDATGVFPWMKIFRGQGIDIGSGPDKLPFDTCQGFDLADGDANKLSTYFKPESFNYVHASQCLEHMLDPIAALKDWTAIVARPGYIVFTVPDWVLYEGLRWPSAYNPDHKSTWSMFYRQSNAPIHCYLPDFLAAATPLAEVRRCKLIDTNYDYKTMTAADQTFVEANGVEAFIEVVLRLTNKI